MEMLSDFTRKLLRGVASAVRDQVAAVIRVVPIVVAVAVTVNVLDASLGIEPLLHRTSLPKTAAPGMGESAVNDAGSTMAAWTLLALAGPWFVTTTLQLVRMFTLALDGQVSATERLARCAGRGVAEAATVNGPTLACPAVLVAVTE
jgi:hypothetical protein